MPEVVWQIETPLKITKEMADKWVDSLELTYLWEYGGGIRFDGYSYHDIDLNITPPKEEPCPCKELVKVLPSAPFDIDINCKTCGAYINYSKEIDTWTYIWNPKTARIILNFPSNWRGLDIAKMIEIVRRIEALEAKKP